MGWIWLDGCLLHQEEFGWSFFRSNGFQEGVYETIRVEHQRIPLLKEHLCRLFRSRTLRDANLKHSLTLNSVEQALRMLSKKNALTCQTLQANLFAYLDNSKRLHLAICIQELKPCENVEIAVLTLQKRNGLEHFFREKTFFTRFLLDDKTKGLPSFPNAEAVFYDPEESLLEGAHSALLFFKDGLVHTPELELPILPSIGRKVTLQTLRAHGIPIREGRFQASDLFKADAVYLLNALRGLLPVVRVS